MLLSNFVPYQFLLEYKKSLFEEQQQWTASSTVILRLQVIAKGNIQIGSICIQQAATALLFPLALASLAYWVALRLIKIRLALIPNYNAWYSILRDFWKRPYFIIITQIRTCPNSIVVSTLNSHPIDWGSNHCIFP